MNNNLKAIYDNLCSTKGIELDSERAKTLEENFFNTYGKNLRTEVFDKFFCDVYAIITEHEETAFSLGFYTAVELLTGRK